MPHGSFWGIAGLVGGGVKGKEPCEKNGVGRAAAGTLAAEGLGAVREKKAPVWAGAW